MEDDDPANERPVLAVDLGGTQIRAALVTPDLEVRCRRAEPTHDELGVEDVVRRICAMAVAVRDDARADGRPQPVGVGISSPGPLDPWRGLVVAPPNLAGWHDVPLADRVEEAVGLPTFLERDTNVAVAAEWRYGAARGADNVVYVTVSTGIGGGVIVDGRPLHGPDGTAGEVGHLTVEIDGPLCGCGRPGHVEAIASGSGIARAARALLGEERAPILAQLADEGARVDAALVARAADAGDVDCRSLLDHAWDAVAAMVASLVNLLNPEVIVLGGSIATHQPRLRETIVEQLPHRAFALPAARVRIVPSRFGDDVSLVGALSIVNDRLGDAAFDRERRMLHARRSPTQ